MTRIQAIQPYLSTLLGFNLLVAIKANCRQATHAVPTFCDFNHRVIYFTITAIFGIYAHSIRHS